MEKYALIINGSEENFEAFVSQIKDEKFEQFSDLIVLARNPQKEYYLFCIGRSCTNMLKYVCEFKKQSEKEVKRCYYVIFNSCCFSDTDEQIKEKLGAVTAIYRIPRCYEPEHRKQFIRYEEGKFFDELFTNQQLEIKCKEWKNNSPIHDITCLS